MEIVYNERDWIEDFPHENGRYWNRCIYCHEKFTGHKRRVVCYVCASIQSVGPRPTVTFTFGPANPIRVDFAMLSDEFGPLVKYRLSEDSPPEVIWRRLDRREGEPPINGRIRRWLDRLLPPLRGQIAAWITKNRYADGESD